MGIDYFTLIWFFALLVLATVYSHHLFQRFHWSFALAVSYTIIHTVVRISYLGYFQPYGTPVNLGLALRAYGALTTLLLVITFMEKIKVGEVWLGRLCLLNVILTLILWPFHLVPFNWMMGLAVNPGMNCIILALTLPFIYRLKHLYTYLFTGFGALFLMLKSGERTPILGILCAVATALFFNLQKKNRVVVILGLANVLGLIFLFFPHFFHSNGRVLQWRVFYGFWREHFNIMIGSGLGSFYVFGPIAQVNAETVTSSLAHPEVMAWAHSDIYQTFLELGLVGLVLWVLAVCRIIYNLKDDAPYLLSAVVFVVSMMTFYPLHFPIHLIIGAILAAKAIKSPLEKPLL